MNYLWPFSLVTWGNWLSEKRFLSKVTKTVPAELFKILKDDAVRVLHSICQQIWKTQQWPQDWKRAVFIAISKKNNVKECSNCCTTALISHASKVMLKILQARLQQYMNQLLSDVQAGFRKGRGTRDKIATIHWITEKGKNSRKTSTSASLTKLKPLTVWISTICEKFLKKWEYQTTLPASWETCMQDKKQQLELDMEQKTGSKLSMSISRIILSSCLYNFCAEYIMWNAGLDEAISWIQDCQEKYQ